jgi:hypothetical protein
MVNINQLSSLGLIDLMTQVFAIQYDLCQNETGKDLSRVLMVALYLYDLVKVTLAFYFK